MLGQLLAVLVARQAGWLVGFGWVSVGSGLHVWLYTDETEARRPQTSEGRIYPPSHPQTPACRNRQRSRSTDWARNKSNRAWVIAGARGNMKSKLGAFNTSSLWLRLRSRPKRVPSKQGTTECRQCHDAQASGKTHVRPTCLM